MSQVTDSELDNLLNDAGLALDEAPAAGPGRWPRRART
jgi:flagellar motor switch protein FliN/FliY